VAPSRADNQPTAPGAAAWVSPAASSNGFGDLGTAINACLNHWAPQALS